MRPKAPNTVPRQTVLRVTALPLLLLAMGETDLSTVIRRAVVRGAQTADKLDGLWQRFSGEVLPLQQSITPPVSSPPPAFLELEYARAALDIPLEVGAQLSDLGPAAWASRLQQARQQSVLLYGESAEAAPRAGAATRVFPRALASAVADGYPANNATVFNFEVYVRWRLLQDVIPAGQRPLFTSRLGEAMLRAAPLRTAIVPLRDRVSARGARSLRDVVDGCNQLLACMAAAGLVNSLYVRM